MWKKWLNDYYRSLDDEGKEKFSKRLTRGFYSLGVIALVIVPVSLSYINRYTFLNDKIAVKGVYFKSELDISKYTELGKGNNLFGDYKRYSRSDRHGETIKVYVK